MKRFFPLLAAALLSIATSCQKAPRAEHVVILGFDAMSARGIQRAETPNFNRLIENGAVSLHTRCVRETSSSQNWMSMVSASPIEMHGVFTNKWQSDDPDRLEPALKNALGLYPTIFDHIRSQKPELRQEAFIEWKGETRMYDMSVFDKVCVKGDDPDVQDYKDLMEKALSTYLEDRPELMFLSMDITDGMGHTFGHESDEYLTCITEMDEYVGRFVDELEKRGWMKNTVIIITADHGGIGPGHGGDTMAEFEIPILLYGKGVTRGQVMKNTNLIYDVGATAAGLLGVELPWECRGKLLAEAFGPKNEGAYVPMPMVRPFTGKATGDITISCDIEGAEIFYTLDGSEPGENSIRYEGPFKLEKSALLRAVGIKGGCKSGVTENYLYPDADEPPVYYKLYTNVTDLNLPDFTKFGKPDETGYLHGFSLDEFGYTQDVNFFAVLFSSYLVIDEEDDYTFKLVSDDSANVYLDGNLLIDNSKGHSLTIVKTAKTHLAPGRHFLKVEYYDYTKMQLLDLKLRKGEGPYRPILPSQLDR